MMGVPRFVPLILILLALGAGGVVLTKSMRRMKPRGQFLVLLMLGVISGFTLLATMQLPRFPLWLGISLMVVVVTASPFAIWIFVRSLIQEDEQTNETHGTAK
ncbi:MAG: hypothetical protein ABI164_09085 [Acidobacteriaceae bacterium]